MERFAELPEYLEDIRKMGFDYACDDIDPKKFKYQTEEEKEAFKKGYEEGLDVMGSIEHPEGIEQTQTSGKAM